MIERNIEEETKNRRKEMIERIKACGQYIVDNADSILGTEKYITNLYVTCNFYDRSEVPYVSITRDVAPDSYIENR